MVRVPTRKTKRRNLN